MASVIRVVGFILLLCAVVFITPQPCRGASLLENPKDSQLTDLSLEDLTNIEITSVSKTPQFLREAGAAVYVLNQEDIKRSGALTIPDLLRTVPGIEVARLNANQWAISSRGFNGRFANKLLVLIDGRSAYTPLFSGVYWEAQDTMLEDIDRIEVVRGPGGTVWGANAVNGVINIITKKSSETQGGLVSSGYGTEEQGFGSFRYGGAINSEATYRIYGKYFNRDSGPFGHDDWRSGRGGFRTDWTMYEVNQFTVQGDFYQGELGQEAITPTLLPPFSRMVDEDLDSSGANLLSRWSHQFSPDSDCSLQAYVERTYRNATILRETRHTFDLDWQHRIQVDDMNELLWGAGYRLSSDDTRGSFEITLDPADRDTNVYSTFIQDQITVIEDHLWVTPGSKLEHNDFTGFEVQPGLRAVFSPETPHTIWAAISRAVRTPSRAEEDARIAESVLSGPTVVRLQGNQDMGSENLTAYEFGYRVEATQRVNFDTSFFYNVYDNLFSLERGTPFAEAAPAPPHVVIPFTANNNMSGETYGTEVSVRYQPMTEWTLVGGYSYLEMNLHRRPGSTDLTSEQVEGQSPQHQFFIQSRLDLPCNVQFDQNLRYVSAIPQFQIPGYLAVDARIAWKPRDNLEVSFVGQNLSDNAHPEFGPSFIETQTSEVERSFYGKVTWQF